MIIIVKAKLNDEDIQLKRFTQKDEDDWEILDRGKHFAYAHSGYQAEKIINELNELVDTNRELYKENKQLKAINKYLIEILEHSGATVEIEHIKGG